MLMFMIFLVVSVILWSVLSLNEEDQHDVRLPVRITHVPDSVTLISNGPEALNASVIARGTQLMKMSLGSNPTLNIDFRAFARNGLLQLNNNDLKGLIRASIGGAQVSVVYPDSISLPYTSHNGYSLPVKIDYKVTPSPQSALSGRPRLSQDSVKIYMAPGFEIPDGYTSVASEPIRILGIDKNTTQKVKLVGPAHSRVIPDSIEVTFDVEPMIFKSRKVVIEPINVPHGIKLITFPAQIDVFFMVPMSSYSKGDVRFRVAADYRTINTNSRMVKLSLRDVPTHLQNVQLSADSAEYIIEKH
ncbi:MAG: hypothetical protein NC548_45865 [Lachnospiraceae bacterium]|nr:hypothetical protein [Lachnospiraceae bacterium]